MPVMSVIAKPKNGDKLDDVIIDDKYIEIKGIAWSGGGRGIIKVEVSIDNGETWKVCEMEKTEQVRGKEWCWTLWKIKYEIEERNKVRNIMCRAIDSSFNSQPNDVKHIVNGTIYLNNSWHCINIQK